MNKLDPEALDWQKVDGLIPATVQDAQTGTVLMTGYMNQVALETTLDSGHVTFWSRSRQRLWTKGETSGNVLALVDVFTDCDNDALLILANPKGPTCHLGTVSCFGNARSSIAFLGELDKIIADRKSEPSESSYTTTLFDAGIDRIAQKVGEEGVETALAAVGRDDASLVAEVGDLMYHVLVLLHSRNLCLEDVSKLLAERHQKA